MLFCSSLETDGSAIAVGSTAMPFLLKMRCVSETNAAETSPTTSIKITNCLRETRYMLSDLLEADRQRTSNGHVREKKVGLASFRRAFASRDAVRAFKTGSATDRRRAVD